MSIKLYFSQGQVCTCVFKLETGHFRPKTLQTLDTSAVVWSVMLTDTNNADDQQAASGEDQRLAHGNIVP